MKFNNKILMALWGVVMTWSSQAHGMKQINTITTPEVLYTHQPVASSVKEVIDFNTNAIGALKVTIANVMILSKYFAIVVGFGIIVASIFQYLKYKENPHAMRFSYVSTTFFCGLALVGLSYITG